MFPSKYFAVEDLDGKTIKVRISSLDQGQMRDGTTKFILSFADREKGLVLNKTNGKVLAKAFGKDSAGWVGQEVELYTVDTEYCGEPCKGLRLRKPEPMTTGDLDDDIPF